MQIYTPQKQGHFFIKYYLAGDSQFKIQDWRFKIKDSKKKVWKCYFKKSNSLLKYVSKIALSKAFILHKNWFSPREEFSTKIP